MYEQDWTYTISNYKVMKTSGNFCDNQSSEEFKMAAIPGCVKFIISYNLYQVYKRVLHRKAHTD